jgi:hypothetical protein
MARAKRSILNLEQVEAHKLEAGPRYEAEVRLAGLELGSEKLGPRSRRASTRRRSTRTT